MHESRRDVRVISLFDRVGEWLHSSRVNGYTNRMVNKKVNKNAFPQNFHTSGYMPICIVNYFLFLRALSVLIPTYSTIILLMN